MLVTAGHRAASVADDVFEERAVDGGLWRQRIPQRRERREDDGEGEAVAVAVPLQEKGLGGPDQMVVLLGRQGRPLLKTECRERTDDLTSHILRALRLLARLLWRGRRGAPAQHHPQQNERGSPYGRFTRTRCPW